MFGYFAAKPASAALRASPSAGEDSHAPRVTSPEIVLGSNAAAVDSPGPLVAPPPVPVEAPGPLEPVLPLGPQAAMRSAAAKPSVRNLLRMKVISPGPDSRGVAKDGPRCGNEWSPEDHGGHIAGPLPQDGSGCELPPKSCNVRHMT